MAPSVGETGNLPMCEIDSMQRAKAQKSVSFSLGGELYLVFGLGWIRRRTILILIEIVYSRKDEKPQGFCFLFRCCVRSLLNRTCFGQSVGFCSFSFDLGFEKRLSINRDIAL